MEVLASWWGALSSRERILIGIMLALLLPLLAWFALWKPAISARENARERLVLAANDARKATGQLAKLKNMVVPQLRLPLAETVSRTAAEAGFELASTQTEGNGRVRIEISSARAAALFEWLATLDRLGIFVEESNIVTKSDATLGVSLTLRQAER